ncbi:hypothetical protein GE278_08970 [Enterobacteriaceae bacterium Kacie_13]|nr:hypothetical protein GE278_08970 [Enterobacteriaceae bacterium Kacie_13]
MDKTERHNFTKFPYRSQIRENGDINNGGFDLVQYPEKIHDIHEINEYPWFRDFITSINKKDGLFMTFGCAIGHDEPFLHGYIDLSCRHNVSERIKKEIDNLDVNFYEYLSQAIPDGETRQQATQYIQSILLWLSSPLEIYGESYSKVNLTFRARQEDGLKWAFDHLSYFLTEYFPKNEIL